MLTMYNHYYNDVIRTRAIEVKFERSFRSNNADSYRSKNRSKKRWFAKTGSSQNNKGK
eukprot:COSAG06_NODE_60524_length_270_cov_1.210526_1_plen_57_part_10